MKPPRLLLNPRLLQGFAEVVRTGSTTAAARELGLSQSAVSRMIAQLEAQVGFELFWRDRGRLVPTKDGMRLVEETELALAGLERVESLAHDIAGLSTGELNIVAPPSFTQTIVPDIAAKFLASFPGVRLSIESRSVETARTMIATRVVDGGFLKLPVDVPDITAREVFHCGTVCVLPRSHALAGEGCLSPAKLANVPLVLLGARRDVRNAVERAFRKHQVRPQVAIETTTVGSACALAHRGLGVAIVNERLAREFLGNDLVAVPFSPAIPQAYAFAWSSISSPSRLAERFIDCVVEHFSSSLLA